MISNTTPKHANERHKPSFGCKKKQICCSQAGSYLLAATLALLTTFPTGCVQETKTNPEPQKPLVEKTKSGPVELTILAEPPKVHLERDILLTMRVHAPSNVEVHLPPLANRLK